MSMPFRASAVSGPLAPYAAGFEEWLAARGYLCSARGKRLWQLDHLSRWLEREGLAAGELTPERGAQFVAVRRAAGYRTWVSARSLRLPLAYLREAGVARPVVPAEGPLEVLLGDYRRYLAGERGLVPRTIVRYEGVARLFLEGRLRGDELDLQGLRAADVSVFLARECPKRSVCEARHIATGLRCLLRFLHVAGLTGISLRWAVPRVADWRDRTLPRGLEPAALARLLGSCDRRRTVGVRDHAILLLLSRLGLRAGEVAAMTLDDLDWRHGEILVRGKGDRHERLPLPVDVGQALARYLRRRAPSESRALFLCVLAPRGPVNAKGVSKIVREACIRAGLAPMGAHPLRHTAASEMLRAGASLAEVGQVLRHRQLHTTALYAKVDRVALRALARPWPGVSA